MADILLTRDAFRELCLARDGNKCVNCGLPATAVHHILERRLFPDGGYYLNNGASLCDTCHLQAEATLISCDTIRRAAGIETVVLPPHFFVDGTYDKWGNAVMPNGMRMCGDLFDEEPVQKVLKPVMHLFVEKVKYPRTFHFPWSPNLQNDDRMLQSTAGWEGTEVVVTEKMDGEGTTMYHNDLHARSLEFEPHASRTFIKAIHGSIAHDIPEGYRICGENLTAVHSVRYSDLPSYFMVFGIWKGMTCLSWEETCEWCALLGLWTVPLIYWGKYSDDLCKALCDQLNPVTQEGLVVRPARAFHMKEYPYVVGKCVRERHVTTDQHWMRKEVEFNGLAEG
jgi:hypothetical protein